jgi:hypothetical protein
MSQVHPVGSSLVGRVYIPLSLPPQADSSVKAFPASLELEFRLMLKGTRNCSIFN